MSLAKVGVGRQSEGVSLRELQRSLRLGGVSESTISAGQVDELARRLEKVRSWGGAYAAIEFSPEIEALLARRKTVGGGIYELPKKSPGTVARA